MGCNYGQECSVGWTLRETEVACFEVKGHLLPSGLRNTKSPDTLSGSAAKIRFGYGTFQTDVF